MNVAKLKGKMVEVGMNVESLAEKIGIDRSSLYRKLSSIDKLTVGEAVKIKDAVELSNDEALEIFLT